MSPIGFTTFPTFSGRPRILVVIVSAVTPNALIAASIPIRGLAITSGNILKSPAKNPVGGPPALPK